MLKDKIIQIVADSDGTLIWALGESGNTYRYDSRKGEWKLSVESPLSILE